MSNERVASTTHKSRNAMNYNPICQWLDLSTTHWPPDHYTLLGLAAGETDLEKVENAVHARLKRVRSYQLSHPDLATAAMNQLAEAYACLTDPQAKREYDAAIDIKSFSQSSRDSVTKAQETQRMPHVSSADDTVTGAAPTVVEWNRQEPPPVRNSEVAERSTEESQDSAIAADREVATVASGSRDTTVDASQQTDDSSSSSGVRDPLLEAAVGSRSARKGIGTLNGLIHRRKQTHALVICWQRLGRYVKQPKRLLAGSREAKDFLALLARIEHLLDEFPSFLAKPGKPGYRIAMLAVDENPVKAFQDMNYNERVALAKDWVTSLTVLMAHFQFLQKEFARRNTDSYFVTRLRPVISFLDEHRSWGYMVVSIVFLILAALSLLIFTQ